MYNNEIYRAFKFELECSKNCKGVIDKYILLCLEKIDTINIEIQNSISSIRDKNYIDKLKYTKIEIETLLSELLLTSPNIINEDAKSQFIDYQLYKLLDMNI